MIISSVTLCCFCRIQEERDERHRLKGRVSRFEPLPSMEGKRSCKFFVHVFFVLFFSHQNSQFPPTFAHGPSEFVPLQHVLATATIQQRIRFLNSGNKIHTAFLLLLADGSSRRNRPSSGNFVLYTV